ncbi:MAG: hypothetical protein N2C12_19040 [Planctomycetales bacterium]
MRYISMLISLIAITAVVMFSVQNREMSDLLFWNWSIRVPMFSIILATYLLGMITGWGFIDLFKRAFKKKKS